MRSCFQQNSVVVLVSKLVSKMPPGDYIGSSHIAERKL